MVRIARVYDAPDADDGLRVLVDRLWPRGLSKDAAKADRWLKDVAPSNELRHWYGHRKELFGEFEHRYHRELDDPERRAALAELGELVAAGPVTLLTATKDVEISHLAVLAALLDHPEKG